MYTVHTIVSTTKHALKVTHIFNSTLQGELQHDVLQIDRPRAKVRIHQILYQLGIVYQWNFTKSNFTSSDSIGNV